tara:strand:- start:807 stop:1037 length:231 start_codon:yes stop_codon:yes gene_type:complete
MALVTIAKIHDIALAQMVRMKFESEEIPVHLGSEGFATLLGVQSSYSAVRVQVPEAYERRARQVYGDLMETLGQAE